MTGETKLHPLRVRPGARFTCHGDGLCCSDVHLLGPVTGDEARVLNAIDERILAWSGDDRVLVTTVDGRCMFAGAGVCELHARLGPEVKPASCKQFPFMLVTTPTGGRVTTEHRCPCRSMGERAPLTSDAALASTTHATRHIAGPLWLDDERSVSVEEWEIMEAPLIARLQREDPLDVLDAAPLSGDAERWDALAVDFASEEGGGRFGAAIRRFGAAILALRQRPTDDIDAALPWGDAFDRAEARSEPGDPEEMLRDWVADYVWSLEWAFFGTFRAARSELSSRVAIARQIAGELEQDGARADRAMAEAIAVVEAVGVADDYRAFLESLGRGDEPADRPE
ncbi:MAG TPA: hypothetical protein DEF51_31505 [Myxococcales bacterium]|nr:hypothetical protein [Myxococcales bacterium]